MRVSTNPKKCLLSKSSTQSLLLTFLETSTHTTSQITTSSTPTTKPPVSTSTPWSPHSFVPYSTRSSTSHSPVPLLETPPSSTRNPKSRRSRTQSVISLGLISYRIFIITFLIILLSLAPIVYTKPEIFEKLPTIESLGLPSSRVIHDNLKLEALEEKVEMGRIMALEIYYNIVVKLTGIEGKVEEGVEGYYDWIVGYIYGK